MSTDRLDAFDRAGLRLSDEEKQACLLVLNTHNAAGGDVPLEAFVSAIFQGRPRTLDLVLREADFLREMAAFVGKGAPSEGDA